jgi:hypothetical protein
MRNICTLSITLSIISCKKSQHFNETEKYSLIFSGSIVMKNYLDPGVIRFIPGCNFV